MKRATVEPLEKKWLSLEEASMYLGSSKDYIYQLINDNRVWASRYGKKTWVEKKSLDSFLESNRI